MLRKPQWSTQDDLKGWGGWVTIHLKIMKCLKRKFNSNLFLWKNQKLITFTF